MIYLNEVCVYTIEVKTFVYLCCERSEQRAFSNDNSQKAYVKDIS